MLEQPASTIPPAPEKRRRMSRKLAVVFVTMAIAIALLVLVVRSPTYFQSLLPLTRLGTTNSLNGALLAIFSVSNVLGSQVTFFAATEEKQGGTWPFERNHSIGSLTWTPDSWQLSPHASDRFFVPVPSNGIPCRVWLQYRKDP